MKETYRDVGPESEGQRLKVVDTCGPLLSSSHSYCKARSLTSGSDGILQILTTRLWIV